MRLSVKIKVVIKTERRSNMKLWSFAAGMAVGVAAATVAVSSMYPSVTRKMKRDGKRLWRGMTNMM